jgi:eukaryotic-like serine/threonine-protein kinase
MDHISLGDSATAAAADADTPSVLPRTHEEKPSLLNGRYELTGCLLGKGACGKVVLAIDYGNHMQRVAIKILNTSGHISEYLETVRKEAEIGAEIPYHPNVLQTLDSFLIGYKFYIVMELVDGKSFDVYMHETKITQKTQSNYLVILYQMALAIAHLHANRIVHRDIKPANFIVSQNPNGTIHVKLIDFGFSNPFDLVEQAAVGTPYFMSPQVAEWIGIDEKCDEWAFGILILLILTKEKTPLYLKITKNSDQAIALIRNLTVNPFPVRLTVNKDPMIVLFATIAKRCLEIKPSMRPSAAEIAECLSAFKA